MRLTSATAVLPGCLDPCLRKRPLIDVDIKGRPWTAADSLMLLHNNWSKASSAAVMGIQSTDSLLRVEARRCCPRIFFDFATANLQPRLVEGGRWWWHVCRSGPRRPPFRLCGSVNHHTLRAWDPGKIWTNAERPPSLGFCPGPPSPSPPVPVSAHKRPVVGTGGVWSVHCSSARGGWVSAVQICLEPYPVRPLT